MGRMIVIPANGGETTTVERSDIPTLKEVQTAVGGYVEAIPLFMQYEGDECEAYCDEDGKHHGRPLNESATALWYAQTGPHEDYLVGDVVILTGDARWANVLEEGDE